MSVLNITIEGEAASGKSTLAQFLEECLRARGFDVDVFDHELGERRVRSQERLNASLETISKKHEVSLMVKPRVKQRVDGGET